MDLSLRSSIALLSVALTTGCAGPARVVRHVEPARLARLAPAVLQPLDERARDAAAEVERDLVHARERMIRAEQALVAARAESPLPADVRAAKIARAERELAWQRTLVEVVTCREAATVAAAEVARAELVSRAGQDVDVEAFKEQHAALLGRVSEATRAATAARQRFEDADRRLSAAKARYAEARSAPVASR